MGIWVTNNRRLLRFVKVRPGPRSPLAARSTPDDGHTARGSWQEELLASWGLEYLATWYWVKVTSDGRLSSPATSPHKKPFEPLVLAAASRPTPTAGPPASGRPPEGWAVCAAPGEHSRKPFLGELLAPFVPPPPPACSPPAAEPVGRHGCRPGEALELFARELRDGWVSAGNEVPPPPRRHFSPPDAGA